MKLFANTRTISAVICQEINTDNSEPVIQDSGQIEVVVELEVKRTSILDDPKTKLVSLLPLPSGSSSDG